MMTVMMTSHSSAPVLSPAKGQHSHCKWIRLVVDIDFILYMDCSPKLCPKVWRQPQKSKMADFLLRFDSFWAKPKKNGHKTKHTQKNKNNINCKKQQLACRYINIPFLTEYDPTHFQKFTHITHGYEWAFLLTPPPPPPPPPLKAYGQLRHTVLNKCVASVCVMYEHLCEHGFLCVSACPCMYMVSFLKRNFFSICVGLLFYVFGVDLNNTHFLKIKDPVQRLFHASSQLFLEINWFFVKFTKLKFKMPDNSFLFLNDPSYLENVNVTVTVTSYSLAPVFKQARQDQQSHQGRVPNSE